MYLESLKTPCDYYRSLHNLGIMVFLARFITQVVQYEPRTTITSMCNAQTYKLHLVSRYARQNRSWEKLLPDIWLVSCNPETNQTYWLLLIPKTYSEPIRMELFTKMVNGYLKADNYFHKKLQLSRSTGFWIRKPTLLCIIIHSK